MHDGASAAKRKHGGDAAKEAKKVQRKERREAKRRQGQREE